MAPVANVRAKEAVSPARRQRAQDSNALPMKNHSSRRIFAVQNAFKVSKRGFELGNRRMTVWSLSQILSIGPQTCFFPGASLEAV